MVLNVRAYHSQPCLKSPLRELDLFLRQLIGGRFDIDVGERQRASFLRVQLLKSLHVRAWMGFGNEGDIRRKILYLRTKGLLLRVFVWHDRRLVTISRIATGLPKYMRVHDVRKCRKSPRPQALFGNYTKFTDKNRPGAEDAVNLHQGRPLSHGPSPAIICITTHYRRFAHAPTSYRTRPTSYRTFPQTYGERTP